MTGLGIASAVCTIGGGICGIANSLLESKKQDADQAKMCEDIASKVAEQLSAADDNKKKK